MALKEETKNLKRRKVALSFLKTSKP